MKHGKIITLAAAILAVSGIITPVMTQASATMVQSDADQVKKDKAFAEKLRALKDRQHEEWKQLMEAQFAEIDKLKHDNPHADISTLRPRHDKAKRAMKERHKAEMTALKAEYQG